MGVSKAVRHGRDDGGRDIVAFDFAGTLTVRDSFNSFLVWRAPLGRLVSGLVRLTPAALGYVFDRDRERLKSSAVAVFLKGLTPAELDAEAEAFCDKVWDRFMRPDALAVWRRRGDPGDRDREPGDHRQTLRQALAGRRTDRHPAEAGRPRPHRRAVRRSQLPGPGEGGAPARPLRPGCATEGRLWGQLRRRGDAGTGRGAGDEGLYRAAVSYFGACAAFASALSASFFLSWAMSCSWCLASRASPGTL